jgi:hypothetical protein
MAKLRESGFFLAGILLSVPAAAEERTSVQCYDAIVSARIRDQVPSEIGDCGDGCIIMWWPWFIDLEIRRVLDGVAPKGIVTVLAVQHTYWSRDLGFRRWWLRRNSQGGFNVLSEGDDAPLRRCAQGTAPAKAYIEPAAGGSLEELRREGEKHYGRRP